DEDGPDEGAEAGGPARDDGRRGTHPDREGDAGQIGAKQGGQTASGSRRPRGRGDRKSTRLNSSHVKISYAVFCLKKKKYTMSGIHPLWFEEKLFVRGIVEHKINCHHFIRQGYKYFNTDPVLLINGSEVARLLNAATH